MSAWDLTCRPPATGTTAVAHANEQLPTRTAHQVGGQHHDDRLAKLRSQQVTAAVPLAWHNNSSPATTSEHFQALLTTATSNITNLDHKSTRGYLCTSRVSLSQHVAWLEALRKQQDLARQCSAMVTATAPALNMPTQQHSLGSTMLLNSECNSGQSSASSSPGGSRRSTTSSSPVESIDLTLTSRLICTQQLRAVANKPHRSSSMSLLSSSSASTSSANSFDGDYTLINTPNLSNSTSKGAELRVDRRAKKKDQNRRAAYNYRRKKMEERDRLIEEEAWLVHRHVRLSGKIARLEEKILAILSTKTLKVSAANGFLVHYLCPVCMKSCVNITTLRNHLKTHHHQQPVPNNKTADTINKMSLWATTPGYTMSATNDSSGDLDDDDDEEEEDRTPHNGTIDKPSRDSGARCTMPEGDMIDRDDDENDSTTF